MKTLLSILLCLALSASGAEIALLNYSSGTVTLKASGMVDKTVLSRTASIFTTTNQTWTVVGPQGDSHTFTTTNSVFAVRDTSTNTVAVFIISRVAD